MPFHRHLHRQLQKLRLAEDRLPELAAWNELLGRISRTYHDTDRERYTLERNIMLSSTEMQELHARLGDERDRFRAIFESVQVGIWCVELDGRVVDINPALGRTLGYSATEMIGRFIWDFVDARDVESYRSYYGAASEQRGPLPGVERHYVRKDGEIVYTIASVSVVRSDDGRPSFNIHVTEDVTEQRRLEIELRHAQKLESVGRLAAGVAHEINTPIQFINDSVHFVRDAVATISGLVERYRGFIGAAADSAAAEQMLPLAQEMARAEDEADLSYLLENVPKALERSVDGLNRVAAIVRSMKEFAHPDSAEMTLVDLNRAIESTLLVARGEYKDVADIETQLGEIPPVACHGGEINQVILNILVNAAHAIEDASRQRADAGSRGRIVVRTTRDADSVVVSITDTGLGIPVEIHDRVFDPFFTTKDVGRGTGQGLAIARSVTVDKHGGKLTFETEPGQGTTFFMRLPVDAARSARTERAA